MTNPGSEQLVRSLRLQLESQLRAGDGQSVERILDAHPELQSDEEAVMDLIYTEIATREELGIPPEAQDLRQRFPSWIDRIDRLLAVHRAFQLDQVENSADTNIEQVDTDVDVLGHRPEWIPQRIDQYQLLEEIGQGGMGIVYRARHLQLNRIVAIKLIRQLVGAGESGKRLIHEAKTVARLDHPGIVRVYDAGFDGSIPFVSLEYVEGGSLASKLAQSTLDAKTACRMLQQLSSAMEYAHAQGVIHRDLKPANVLLASNGQPKIADFGLAKSIWERPADDLPERLTQTGAILGSLCYMAPEQVAGRDELVNARSDVYGLGTILYEMLVGRPPFVRESPLDTAHDIQFRDAVSPRAFVPGLAREVETICLKCLEKRPAERYASASDLADDLERFLAGQPLRARPIGRVRRTLKWVKRKPLAAAVLVACIALPMAYGLLQKRYADEILQVATQLDEALTGEKAARQLADSHFWQVFDSVSSVQRRLASSGLDHEPRMQQARLDVADDALEIIEQLRSQRPNDARIRAEWGHLLKLRGQILLELGRKEEANTAYSRSIAAYDALLELDPHDTKLRHSRAAAVASQAEALKWLMQYEESQSAYAAAAQELSELADRSSQDKQLQNDYVQTLSGWSAVLIDAQQLDQAEKVLLEADLRSSENATRWPTDARSQSIRGQILWALGRLARDQSDNQRAEDYAARGLACFEKALQLAPGDRTYQNFLVEAGLFHANQLQKLRRFEAARAPIQRASRLLDELQGRYPSIRRYSQLRINVLRELSLLEVNLGNETAAVALAEEALATRRQVLQHNPDDRRSAFEFAGSLANLANRLAVTESLGASRLDRAEAYAREALAIPERFDTDSIESQRLVRFARYNLVLALARQDRIADTRHELEKLTRETSSSPMDLRYLADGWSELLGAVHRTGKDKLAEEVQDNTLRELERAIDAGYRDVGELQNNQALDPLRAEPRFQQLLTRASTPPSD